MKKESIQKATDFLGVKVLTPLEAFQVVGGFAIYLEPEHHESHHESHHGGHHESHHESHHTA
ncbi:hypothetical protein [Chitinophaga nivalis]|uniref:Uncharacterized protein n=1 Tax=Chitinophaga nivalis TaxID=2991709 RepID=A0ABT3IKX6_9BACT|nr:hypothetical protein [Chitinophaga nivalis]MCW3465711.1 hypothetical protein [Chitinophaga nivalis]MCW3484598.1 hypothetical protein [Chitinophaga nivalis]